MMNVEDIPQMFQFSVKTTEADKTEDAKRQMLTMKHQLMAQYMQQAMQVVQMLDSPQIQQMPTVREFVAQMYVALTKLMEESLELFNVDKTADYLPDYQMQELQLQFLDIMRQPQIMQMKEQLEGMRSGGQSVGGEAGGTGISPPGYTAGENAPGNAGNQANPAVAGPPGAGGGGGPVAQQPGPGTPGPR